MIIFTPEAAATQVAELTKQYPDLTTTESSPAVIRLRGDIWVNRSFLNFTVDQSYKIEITIPLNSSALPNVKDVGGSICDDYPHRYISGELCLETEAIIRIRFIDGFSLIEWMGEFVEPYYFSYEYFCRYGIFPFGDRPHGLDGLINTYQDLFREEDLLIAWKLMRYCVTGRYRGHLPCPCGSGKRTRNCHGEGLLLIMSDSRKRDIIKNDVNRIKEELEKREHARKNTKTAE